MIVKPRRHISPPLLQVSKMHYFLNSSHWCQPFNHHVYFTGSILHCESKRHPVHVHNFAKYWSVFKILSLLH